MQCFKIKNYQSFQKLKTEKFDELNELKKLEQSLNKTVNSQPKSYFKGFSWPANQAVKFLIDKQYSNNHLINFRERLVCPVTQFNNRIRGAIHVFEETLDPSLSDDIYITEQYSLLYRWLKKKYVNTIGSEFITASNYFNKLRFRIRLFPHKLIHEDLTSLSFVDNQFKFILSFDCLEHISNYRAALKEAYRVLKVGGTLLLTAPFDLNAKHTLVRASINQDGTTNHHVEPEYHGNPVSKQGSLSYYTFAWDLLDVMRDVGFKEVNSIVYWSKKHAYLGGEQLLISAEK